MRSFLRAADDDRRKDRNDRQLSLLSWTLQIDGDLRPIVEFVNLPPTRKRGELLQPTAFDSGYKQKPQQLAAQYERDRLSASDCIDDAKSGT